MQRERSLQRKLRDHSAYKSKGPDEFPIGAQIVKEALHNSSQKLLQAEQSNALPLGPGSSSRELLTLKGALENENLMEPFKNI